MKNYTITFENGQSVMIKAENKQIAMEEAARIEGYPGLIAKVEEDGNMKKATLNHDDVKEFILVDADGTFITTVNAGEGEEPDWELVEKQANAEGYTIED